MKVFLRSKKSRLYRAGAKGWAVAEDQALGFTSVPQATRFALDNDVPEAEIVVRPDFSTQEYIVPVLAQFRDFSQPMFAAA